MTTVNAENLGIVTRVWSSCDGSGRYGCIVGLIDANGMRTTDLDEAVEAVIYDATKNDFELWDAAEMRAKGLTAGRA